VTKLRESCDFFRKLLGMSLVFEASWVAMLARREGDPIALGLMPARRFKLRDPSGIRVHVVEQIEPVSGFWDKYVGERPGCRAVLRRM
jgi:catechol 2,3-dioxygenase-like lactoylglutathione lyase family enzyme